MQHKLNFLNFFKEKPLQQKISSKFADTPDSLCTGILLHVIAAFDEVIHHEVVEKDPLLLISR